MGKRKVNARGPTPRQLFSLSYFQFLRPLPAPVNFW